MECYVHWLLFAEQFRKRKISIVIIFLLIFKEQDYLRGIVYNISLTGQNIDSCHCINDIN